MTELQEGNRAYHGVVELQPRTKGIELNTVSNIPIHSVPRPKLPIRRQRSDKVGNLSEPTALPPVKKRKTFLDATVSPSLSSQQDLDTKMASTQYLVSFPQQNETIEIRHRAMASCIESSTLPLLTMGENITIEEIQDTLSGEHEMLVTVPTIITVEEPSQAFEGKSNYSPTISESFSPLSEGTSLTPLRYFSLTDLSGESERQLAESDSEKLQISNQIDLIDSVEDRESRIPIALPVTSLEGAKVISDAGTTSKGKELVLSVVRKTPSDTHAREQSETLMSGREVSAHTNTNTDLLAQIQNL